mmetsp:Transcript_13721/g.15386  ORF Transcript_13721/g.15386 Transcript_13721/m.15386 type:complete len:136 (+) Transcript_13721:163-570(+)
MPCYIMAFHYNSKAIKKLPSLVVFHCFSFIQFLAYALIFYCYSGVSSEILFSMDPTNGFFGWADTKWLLLSTIIITPICGFIGVGSFIFMLDFFPTHIVAGIFLLEPFTGELLGWILGQDSLPSLVTYIGVSFIT